MLSDPHLVHPYQHPTALNLGDRLADRVASFGGSWTFIAAFFGLLLGWIVLNIVGLRHPFDPYPFILLNLVLSCLAAIQAPVIMMSQNRKEQRDRLRAIHDYRVNLKAEHEIRLLHEKIDALDRLLRASAGACTAAPTPPRP